MKRAKLIARLRELADYADPRDLDLHMPMPMPLDLAYVLREAAKALETPPWIPVAEDEPPTNTTLLLSVRDPDNDQPYTTAGWKGAVWHHIFDDVPFDPRTITHWMLLPEPPEEGEP